MTLTPEQEARQHIDAALEAAGWLLPDRAALTLSAGPGVAVREFKMADCYSHEDKSFRYFSGEDDEIEKRLADALRPVEEVCRKAVAAKTMW